MLASGGEDDPRLGRWREATCNAHARMVSASELQVLDTIHDARHRA